MRYRDLYDRPRLLDLKTYIFDEYFAVFYGKRRATLKFEHGIFSLKFTRAYIIRESIPPLSGGKYHISKVSAGRSDPVSRRVNFSHSTFVVRVPLRSSRSYYMSVGLLLFSLSFTPPVGLLIHRGVSKRGGGLIIQMFTVAFKDKLIKACTRLEPI